MSKKYIRQIGKRLVCSRKKRIEIQNQLQSEFMAETENGELLQDIITRMGTPAEIAEEFNNSFSLEEKKKYKKEKWIRRLSIAAILLVLFAALAYWALPRYTPIEDSKYFQKEEVEAQAKMIIDLFTEENYEAMQAYSVEAMQTVLNAEYMDKNKAYFAEDWGALISYGTMFTVQASQMGKTSAAVQMTNLYENTSVTFVLYFNRDMKLEGLWMR